MTARMLRWAPGRFSDLDAEPLLHQLATLPDDLKPAGEERLQAALVIPSSGTWWGLQAAIQHALIDWRDTLVAAGLADEDWPERLDAVLDARQPPRPG